MGYRGYDSCVKAADKRYVSGQISYDTLADEYRFCCDRSGGLESDTAGVHGASRNSSGVAARMVGSRPGAPAGPATPAQTRT